MTNEAHTDTSEKMDIYSQVTNKIIADLESGMPAWRKPWKDHPGMRIMRPLRHNNVPYSGINTLVLWAEAAVKGFKSPYWMTIRQANDLGAQVRKSEHGTQVVFADKFTPDQPEEKTVDEKSNDKKDQPQKTYLKVYTVFNAEQIEGLPEDFYPAYEPVRKSFERIQKFENFIEATKVVIYSGVHAAYSEIDDQIEMPPFENFDSAEDYYVTLSHEVAHWTKHPSRLNRDFNQQRFGDEAYAKEELVAELAACFMAADFGLELTEHKEHSSSAYINAWLRVLKHDKRFIFQAASYAQRAVDYLQKLQPASKPVCPVSAMKGPEA